jgi:sugar phosphate permease
MLFAGTLLATGGFFWLSRIGPGSHYWGAVFGPGVIVAFSLGVLFPPLAAAATMGIGRSEAGLASGLLNTARQVGGSLGLAVLATAASTHTHALERTGLAPGDALAEGFARAFFLAGVLGIAAFAATFVVPARSGRPAPERPAAETVPAPPGDTVGRTVPSGAARDAVQDP